MCVFLHVLLCASELDRSQSEVRRYSQWHKTIRLTSCVLNPSQYLSVLTGVAVMHPPKFRRQLLQLLILCLVSYHNTLAAHTSSSSNLTSTKISPSTTVIETTPLSSILTSFPPAPTQTSNVSLSNPASLVNLFIGTTNGGHVFPGMFSLRLVSHTVDNTVVDVTRSNIASWYGQSRHGYRLTGKCTCTCVVLSYVTQGRLHSTLGMMRTRFST